MTENINSKMLVMSDNWNHISSQNKSALIAKFKTFYVRKSFPKHMQVPDGKKTNPLWRNFVSPSISHML